MGLAIVTYGENVATGQFLPIRWQRSSVVRAGAS
ncbi:uncharacterized protein METZ01_LOCUS191504 [marine metagenome]|uniref:Uncharacterized protein n=1 Tax=marine metagenome TaxID=408172 RepID=A0A382DJJ5_9ZZZZ